jgi:hypothetical protein
MFALDLLVVRRDGRVHRIGASGEAGLIGLPRIADELYRSARVMRVFTHGQRRKISQNDLAAVAIQSAREMESRLMRDDRLVNALP